jgi:FkbM family methyltransferase
MGSVAIYGAGQYGGVFCEALKNSGHSVEFFLDKYSKLGNKDGIAIFRPSDAPSKSVTVYISVAKYEKEIKEELLALGFCDVRSFCDSIVQIKDIFLFFAKLNSLWLVENRAEMVDEAKIAKLSSMLKDEKSRDILSKITAFRKSLNAADYVYPDNKEEYFTEEIDVLSALKGGVRFVDAGAYTGDTLLSICRHCDNVEFVASFEPDSANISKLKESAKIAKQKSNGFFALYPMGVWSKSDILEFSISGDASSGVAKDGSKNTIQIPVCSIDDTLFAVAPNFIKMDIEGAEIEALCGAKECIRAYAPILTICVYHRPSDLWEIPLLIEEILPDGYDMYLRVHEHLGLSSVLYCLPKKGN